MIVRNILDLIGNTPMVQLNNVCVNPNVELYVKLEKFNVGGSVKDRIVKYMIEQAEKLVNSKRAKSSLNQRAVTRASV